MNVGQSSIKLKGNVQTDTTKQPLPVELAKFTGQLVAAEGDLNFTRMTGAPSSKIDTSKELFEEKKSKKELDHERSQDSMVATYVADHKTQQAKLQSSWSNHHAEEGYQGRKLTNQTSEVRLRKGIDEIQGRSAEKIADKKLMIKKGHLFNPALAQAETDSASKGQFTQPKAGGEQKPASSEPSSFNPTLSNQPTVPSADQQQRAGQQAFDSMRAVKTEATQKFDPKAVSKIEAAKGLGKASAPLSKAPVSGFKTGNVDMAGLSMGDNKSGLNKAAGNESKTKDVPTQKYTTKMETKELGQDIKMMLNAQKTEMTLKLKPEHLGKVEIKLSKAGEQLNGKMKVDSVEAKAAMERALPELKENLLNMGIEVDQFTVEVNDQGENSYADAQTGGGQSNQQGPQNASSNLEKQGLEPRAMAEQPKAAPGQSVSNDNLNIYA